uniref:Uncharacterized protein n=1 Tax=Arundo donax TaxID=35708 RepID=A0A0A9CS63_ARUDO
MAPPPRPSRGMAGQSGEAKASPSRQPTRRKAAVSPGSANPNPRVGAEIPTRAKVKGGGEEKSN